MQVVVDSLLTHYLRVGKGRTVVILHGWADSSASFHALSQSLATQYDVIAIDLPGFGGSARPHETWGLDEYVAFTAHFLQKIGVTHIWGIIGHSNGGAIAIRGVSSDSLQPERLILLASAGIRGTRSTRNSALRILTKTGKFFATPLPIAMKVRIRSKLYSSVGSDMLVAKDMEQTFKKVVSQDVRADAAKITIPTLLMYGEQDKATPVWYGEQFHELIDDSTLEILPGASHFLHLDREATVTKAIAEFLA